MSRLAFAGLLPGLSAGAALSPSALSASAPARSGRLGTSAAAV
jgi:hypothetical protein